LTVRRAADVYLEKLEAKNPRTARDTRGRLNLHFLGKFGDELVTNLTKSKLEGWLNSMALKGPDREAARRSKDTANRVLSMVKALLNHALHDPANGITDDHAWRLVKPYHGVAVPRATHFSEAQARALIEATPDRAFANLLTAGFLTGGRYGELIASSVRDFDEAARTLSVDGKTGPRTIILQSEAVTFFQTICGDRPSDEPLLRRSDGARWNRSHQQRRMALALERAGLDREGTFYALRHSYVSRAIEGEVPLNIIADNCGTSVRIIETTYAKVLASKRRDFIERGAPQLRR
jgi:integrase